MSGGFYSGNYFQVLPGKGIRLKDGTLIISGTGSPEGVETAPVGSWYSNGSNGDWYRKLSGTGDTGWVPNTFDLLQDGSLLSPSLAFASNTGSGMCYVDTGTGFLYLVTNGGERFRIGPNEASFTTQAGIRVGEINSNGWMGLDNILIIEDQETSGTNGGTFTTGDWRTRVLNTVKTNRISGASLSSNQITLPSGTYRIQASAPAYRCEGHKTRLRNITALTDILYGTSETSSDIGTTQTRSFIFGEFTLSSSSVLEIQHRCVATSPNTAGLGIASGFSVPEVYAQVTIWRLA